MDISLYYDHTSKFYQALIRLSHIATSSESEY